MLDTFRTDGAPSDRAVYAALGGCCGGGVTTAAAIDRLDGSAERFAFDLGDGRKRVDLLCPDIVCAACMRKIERGLDGAPGVVSARVNLSLKRVGVAFDPEQTSVGAIGALLEGLGFRGKPFDAAAVDDFRADKTGRELLSCLGVAGFAAANVMLLSISVWAGAEDATRDLMHWISGLIALPAVAYAGRPFYRSAYAALRAGRLNMDVPISLAVLLAAGVSLYETSNSGAHAYFDAAVSLLFFLLVGRYLDHRVRGLSRSAAAELAALSASSATVIGADGARAQVAIDDVRPGDRVAVAVGERIPVDGAVAAGASDLDRSMVTGETTPEPARPGDAVHAGMMNLTGPLEITVSATEEQTLLAQITAMIEEAERAPNRYTRLADRAAQVYAPGVHVIAAIAFFGWWIAAGDAHLALLTASALLIITCPCALGLAAPAVQAAAGARLFRGGALLKDGTALEKLGEIDCVVFDKTGTLTTGRPVLRAAPEDADLRRLARALAQDSRHPLSRALSAGLRDETADAPLALREVTEIPGYGVEATIAEGPLCGARARLGRADWCGEAGDAPAGAASGPRVWIGVDGRHTGTFDFDDAPRADAAEIIAGLKRMGLETRILSGDRPEAVAAMAARLGVDGAVGGLSPAEKLEALRALGAEGRKALMVGDGVNDAPALAAAWTSMSPAEASDVSRAAADLVFSGERLEPVLLAVRTAQAARARALENFGVAAVYNALAIPLAMAGLVTPLIAALAMSGSSIVVTLNALRVGRVRVDDLLDEGSAPNGATRRRSAFAPRSDRATVQAETFARSMS